MAERLLNIAVDIDGVLLDFIDGFIPVVHERLGVTISHQDIITHDLHLLLGIPYNELWELVNITLATKVFPAIPGSQEGMKAISHHNISIVTSRPSEHEQRTRDNLKKYGFAFGDIHFRKYLNKFKERDGTDILIEDSLAEALVASEHIEHVVLFRQPWNQFTLNLSRKLIEVTNWREVVEVVGNIESREKYL